MTFIVVIKDIEEGRVPQGYEYKELRSNWAQLHSLWNQSSFSGVKFYEEELPRDGMSWVIKEDVGEFHFDMHRSMITGNRITEVNDLGLLGVSMVNPKDRCVILTEGVSDYFSAKLNCPDRNVLGITSLGGSNTARVLLLNLFDKFLYCCDNDEAGRSGAYKLKSWLEGYGKSVKIWTPDASYKDLTDQFMANIKFSRM